MKLKTVPIILALQLAWPVAARADHGEEELLRPLDSVTSASRFEQPVDEAPASITIISSEQIARHGWRTLEEILDNVRGFSVTSDRNYGTLGIRGFARGSDYNSRILLLLDGRRVNGNIYGDAEFGRGAIVNPAMIERVEVVRGPSSSVYGAGAFFGVVNVITKRGRNLDGTQVSVEAGSHRAQSLNAATGRRLSTDTEYVISGGGFSTRGVNSLYFPEFNAVNNGQAENADSERAGRFFGKFRQGDFTFTAAGVQRERAVPTAAYSTVFNDPRFRTRDERLLFDLRYDRQWSEATQAQFHVSWNSLSYAGYFPINFPPVSLNNDRADARWVMADALFTTRLSPSHLLTWGGEYQLNSHIRQQNYDRVSNLDDTRRDTQSGVFVQDEWRITGSVILNAGLRHDHYATFGGATSPRLGLVWRARPDTAFKLLAGRAYRAPNAYELYYTDGSTQAGNVNLRPENITSRELVIEHEAAANLHLTGSVYRNRIGNFIQQVTNPVSGLLVFQNIGGINTNGWEAEAQWELPAGGEIRAAYSRQSTRDAITGASISGSPQWTGKLAASMPFNDGRATAAVAARLMSARPTLGGNTLSAFALLDLNARLRLPELPHTYINASLLNATNRRYADPGGREHAADAIAQNGRTWRLSLEHLFR